MMNMKRMILALTAIVLMSSSALYSQVTLKIDKAGLQKKIEKSDKDIANPKKAGKIGTWLDRGKVFTDAATAISKHIYEGMPKLEADINIGPSVGEAVKLNGMDFTKQTYPILVAYIDVNGMIRAWEIDNVIYEGALEEAAAAYDKANGLNDGNKKNTEKINAGFQLIIDEYYKVGSNLFFLGQFGKAGEAFAKAIELAGHAGYTPKDSEQLNSLLFNAGLAFYNAQEYQKAVDYFMKAEVAGNERNGDIYILIYNAYRGFANGDVETMKQVEPILDRGFAKYPDNASIVDVLTDLYVILGKDPQELIPVVQQGIEKDPENALLWNGLGRLYERLGDLEKSIEAFVHVTKLLPDNYGAYYSLGVLYYRNAEKLLTEVNAVSYSSQSDYDAALAGVNDEYRKAIEPLEKAHELNPTDQGTLRLLTSLTFRLRAEPGMMEKNEKYKAIQSSLPK